MKEYTYDANNDRYLILMADFFFKFDLFNNF